MNKNTWVVILSALTFTSYFLPWLGGPFNVSPNALIDLHSGQSTLPELAVLVSYLLFIIMAILAPIKELSPKFIIAAGLYPFAVILIGIVRLHVLSEGMISYSDAFSVITQTPIGLGIVVYFGGCIALTTLGVMMMREKSGQPVTASPLAS